jgi:hypothetical protein
MLIVRPCGGLSWSEPLPSGDWDVIDKRNEPEVGLIEPRSTTTVRFEQHFAVGLAKLSPSSYEFEMRAADHDESMLAGELGDLGSIATNTMRPH